jgi:predicted GNAT superfamily acetyltransferase
VAESQIRPLTEFSEFEQCVELQREAWGAADIELTPVRALITDNRIGGLVLGAFDNDRMVGFLNAMPGIRDRMPYWYSHMLAIAREHWNSGIGTQLKLAQRDAARQRGIRLIEWTFDPLESRNAYLNIAKLGVIVRRYYVNLYGATTSRLQQGLESDRLIAEWWIDKPGIQVAGSDVRRVYIPSDLQVLKKQSLKSAQDVQLRVREQFRKNLEDDYFAAGFERKDEWSEYLFIPGASRVYQTD